MKQFTKKLNIYYFMYIKNLFFFNLQFQLQVFWVFFFLQQYKKIIIF